MAAMLDSFAAELSNMPAEMARDEVVMLLGVTEEIEKLQTTLRDLSNFLRAPLATTAATDATAHRKF